MKVWLYLKVGFLIGELEGDGFLNNQIDKSFVEWALLACAGEEDFFDFVVFEYVDEAFDVVLIGVREDHQIYLPAVKW